MAKMLRIECCDPCINVYLGGFTAAGTTCYKCGITGSYTEWPFPKDCPLDAAPAPYSAENPPKLGDVVQVDHYAMPGQIYDIEEGMIQVKGPRANGWWPLGELTFLFRAPSGDKP